MPRVISVTGFLGRRIRLGPHGIRYAGDPKHVRRLLEEWNMNECKAVGTPGSKDNFDEEDEDMLIGLSPVESTQYRRAAARINYMALDRVDLSFASKETARGMSSPTMGDVVNLKRILRYLKGTPEFAFYFVFQECPSIAHGLCDSDWAGDRRTRKSSSGGVLMLGCHTVHHFSSSQSTIALSSAEAE